MKCRHCGTPDTTVLETRGMLGGSVVRRRRGCGNCGGKFDTYEIDGGIWATVRRWAVESHNAALQKKHAMRARDDEIVSMLQAGKPHKEISAKFGLSTSTICYIAKKNGLPGRRGPKRTKPVHALWAGLLKR